MPIPNKNDNKGYPGFAISLNHHPEPEWVGPYRIALRKDGTAFDVLDAGANVLYSGSGKDCYDWANEQVEEGKRYV